MAKMHLKVEQVGNGLHPSDTVVAVKTADGSMERLVVSKRSIRDDTIQIGWPLGEKKNVILVELPRETHAGAWRVWVNKDQFINVDENVYERIRA